MPVTVVLPRDSWSALALILFAAHPSACCPPSGMRPDTSTSSAIADYACSELVPQAVVTSDVKDSPRRLRRLRGAVRLGRGSTQRTTVYVAVPSLGQLFHDGTRRWAEYAQWVTARWYAAWCRIATVQTIGGGWASLRQADKALACAMELYELAQVVGDGDIASKCRVFIGWAQLWGGHRDVALHLFSLERKDAHMRGDVVHQRRCESAIIHATTNPTLNGTIVASPQRQFTLTDCWTKAFSGVDVVP